MKIIKLLLSIFLFISTLNASNETDVVYIDSSENGERSIKDEFFTSNSRMYTISIATLDAKKDDPIEFFKKYQMKNALAYKFGENKEFYRVISGIYETGTQAINEIENLDSRLLRNKPYSAKMIRHQALFNEKEVISRSVVVPKKNLQKRVRKNSSNIFENKNSIYTSGEKDALLLKEEFLTKGSNYYSIALGSITLNKTSIKNFFETYDVGDKALAHVYGKNKDKARIIYGLYKTRAEAQEALDNFNARLKQNSPYSMKMKKFQSFYSRFYPQIENNAPIVKLQMNDAKTKEKKVVAKLDENIKVVKAKEIKKIEVKKEEKPKVVKPKPKPIKKQAPTKVVKKVVQKKKIDPNEGRFLKFSTLEDVYYLEKSGDFNILNEVFLKEGSSFFTVDLGELKLNEISIEEFFVKNDIDTSALAYKYGDNKEYARAIYGAYETESQANEKLKELKLVINGEIRVSNIKNHQKLYKLFHKNGFTKKSVMEKKSLNENDKIVYTEGSNSINLLMEEFFNRNSNKYTISLITYEIGNLDLRTYLSKYKLTNNAVVFPMGEYKSYQRVIYGLFDSFVEAEAGIENLPRDLKNAVPFISRVKTNQRKFESYFNRTLEDYVSNIEKIDVE